MRHRRGILILFSAVILGAAFYHTGNVSATPVDPPGSFSGTTLAMGKFESFDVLSTKALEDPTALKPKKKMWMSWQKTKGTSDVYVQSNVWNPGGSTGWHTHPGHSLIIVTAGEITTYEGDDPSCTPHVYRVGDGIVDHGGDHIHNIRNEGSVAASTIAVQVIPARRDGSSSVSDRRVDAANPGNCPF
jgi:quercetin dioxygenase-like cupin family protein